MIASVFRFKMADESREKKLAAARKKLQKFQQKKTPSKSPVPAKSRKTEDSVSSPASAQASPSPLPSSHPRIPQGTSPSLTPTTGQTTQPSRNVDRSSLPRKVLANNHQQDVSASPRSADNRPLSSTESLHQLSVQVNGLVSEAELLNGIEVDPENSRTRSGISQLEARNQELAADRDEHALTNQQLQLQNEELINHCKRLQDTLQKEKKESEQRLFKEQSTLREQLQVHIQTIGILVSEKSDLQSALALSQQSLKHKAGEADNLSSRLQASRQRVAELERDLASATSSSNQYQKTSKGLDKDKDALMLDVYNLKKANEELAQQNSEISSHLKTKLDESTHLDSSVQDLRTRLSAAELRADQLANQGTQQDTHNALLRVQEEKADLQSKLAQYNQSFQQLTAEREQLSQQFHQHTEHYQRQAQELVQQLHNRDQEKESLLSQQAELQRQMQGMEEAIAAGTQKESQENREEVEELKQRIQQIEADKQSMHSQYQQQVSDNALLSRLYQEKEEQFGDLEQRLARLQEESGDRAALLDSIQGDKATISRAMAQNKELKTQLQELQSAFVKMTNDNMEMLSGLKSEQHISQELGSRLSQQEEELNDMKQQLHSKEDECDNLKSQTHSLNKQLLQQATMADRVQHYEAQSHINETLQRDLTTAQTRLRDVSEENSQLRVLIADLERERAQVSINSPSMITENGQVVSRDDMVDSLSAAIRQLEMERNQLTESFHEQQAQHHALLEQMDQRHSQQGNGPAVLSDVQFVSKENFETLNTAMEMLQDRFASVMREKAELSERCQELEHINLQLSGETETIGEYISLYHSQRDMMKRRQEERERFVVSLAQDKEEMQQKLNQLQNLMMQLIQEKKHPPGLAANHLPSFLGTPTMNPGKHSAITSPASPFGGPVSNQHHHQSQAKKQQLLTDSMESTPIDDESDDWPSISSSASDDTAEEASEYSHEQTANGPKSLAHSPDRSDHTAQQILELLEQIGGSHIIDRGTILDRDFAPCKCCSGTLVDV